MPRTEDEDKERWREPCQARAVKVGDGKMVVDIALPKEHMTEVMTAVQTMQQQMMMQMQQQEQPTMPTNK